MKKTNSIKAKSSDSTSGAERGDTSACATCNQRTFATFLRTQFGRGNDAPRGGKTGDFIEITKYFSLKSLEQHKKEKQKKIEKERAELRAYWAKKESEIEEKLPKVLKSETFGGFSTLSDIGSFVIDGIKYSNFEGDGENRVEVCKCDFSEFQKAECI